MTDGRTDKDEDLKMPSGSEVEAAALFPSSPPLSFPSERADSSRVRAGMASAKARVALQSDRIKTKMRNEPLLFAAFATGAGLVLGLTLRYAQWKMRSSS